VFLLKSQDITIASIISQRHLLPPLVISYVESVL